MTNAVSSRDASPNKTLVLLKFEDPATAHDFILFHSGTTFSRDPGRAETCHPIQIHHLMLQDMSRLDPGTTSLSKLLRRVTSVYELPTCPVCLERMDSIVTGRHTPFYNHTITRAKTLPPGLITTPCTHRFDCRCLHRWNDHPNPSESTRTCPVCRLSHRSSASSKPPPPQCTRCTTAAPEDTWICLICGYLGCSRYQRGHARDHYTETGHAYAMEIATQRVWDYLEDK